jgi:hypothetical protein
MERPEGYEEDVVPEMGWGRFLKYFGFKYGLRFLGVALFGGIPLWFALEKTTDKAIGFFLLLIVWVSTFVLDECEIVEEGTAYRISVVISFVVALSWIGFVYSAGAMFYFRLWFSGMFLMAIPADCIFKDYRDPWEWFHFYDKYYK